MWRHICVEVLVVHGMGLYMDLWVDSHHKRLHILYMCYACKPYLYPWLRTWCQGLNLCGQPEEKSGAEWSDFVCTMFHHGLLTENLKKNSEQNEVTSYVQCFITCFLQKIWRKFWSRMKWFHAYNVSSRASYRKSEENFGAEWSDSVRTMFHHGLLTENWKKISEQNEVTSCVQYFITGFLQKIWRKFWSRMKWLRAYNVSSPVSYRKSEEKFGAEWSPFPASDVSHASYGHWDKWSRKLSIPCQIPTWCYLFQRSSIVISSHTDSTWCYLFEDFNPDTSQKQIEP
jgi:hypothetical protein